MSSKMSSKGGKRKQDAKDESNSKVVKPFMPLLTGLADFRFRSELVRLMGSDIIRINNQNWSDTFQAKLAEDYQRKLDDKEHLLAAAEVLRLHRLFVEGIISEDVEDLSRKKSIKHKALKRSQPSSPSSQSGSSHRLTNEMRVGEELTTRHRQTTYRHPKDIQTQIARESQNRSDGTADFIPHRRLSATGEKKRKVTVTSALETPGKVLRGLPPEVEELYNEETVTGLYQLAERLLKIR